MKNFKKALVATAIILVSAGSAFATNIEKQKAATIEPGFRYDPSNPVEQCIQTAQECSTVGTEICTWSDAMGTHQLFKQINGTTCGLELYKVN